jgi:tryptophan synthase alpha chain
MPNRIEEAFAVRSRGQKLLCPFLTAGYPDAATTPALLLAAQRGGAGCIELGIPFSDPIADGPVIQASFTHALAKGINVDSALDCVTEARRRGLTIPVLAMASFSIIFKRGTQAFAQRCAAAGLDGIILPDVPLEEAPAVTAAIRSEGLRSGLLVAPTTPSARRAAIAKLCDAFVYYLSVSGITGERKELPADIGPNVAQLRQETTAPICVGFGISTASQVRQVIRVADGAIVGSALIRRITQHDPATGPLDKAIEAFVAELATGLLPQQ